MSQFKRNMDILIILAVGFILRFTISFTHSYSNDELSAVSRLRYTNFSDLIEFGVQKGDMHPAGVQIFMKGWSLLFGTSELAMRFPFVLFGTLSILVLFLIGKQWFNRKAGLFAAGLLAVLYFPVMNSEFARPYSLGLLISLLVGYYFFKVLFEPEKKWRHSILLGVLFAAGMYTHYFAFLFVGFVGITGLFFLNHKNWKAYMFSGVLGILLFLPHIGVTSYHLNVGGLQWLAPPEITWLPEFLFYAFNSSWTVVVVILAMLVIAMRPSMKYATVAQPTVKWLPFIWFFGIYILGHLLSYISTPVLKFPVMLFAFPYFLIIIGWGLSRIRAIEGVLAGVMLVGLVSTVTERELYGNRHYALFKEPGMKIAAWNSTYGSENIYTIYNLNNPDYMNFYAGEWGGDSIQFDWDLLEFHSHYELYRDLDKNQQQYCVLGYSSRLTLVQVFETVAEFYPELVDFEQYNNGAVFLFKKSDQASIDRAEMEIARFDDFAQIGEWEFDPDYSSGGRYFMDSIREVGPVFKFHPRDLYEIAGDAYEHAYLKVEVEADFDESDELTVTFTGDRNGEPIKIRDANMWIGMDVEEMLLSKQRHGIFAFKIPPYIFVDDELKIGLWNRSGTPITLTEFSVTYVENIWNP